jgi:hypothetical protein
MRPIEDLERAGTALATLLSEPRAATTRRRRLGRHRRLEVDRPVDHRRFEEVSSGAGDADTCTPIEGTVGAASPADERRWRMHHIPVRSRAAAT